MFKGLCGEYLLFICLERRKSFTAPQLEPYSLNLENRDCFAKKAEQKDIKTRNKQKCQLQLNCVYDHKIYMMYTIKTCVNLSN